MADFDYFGVCKTCNIFCCKIFRAFVATNEIEKIKVKLKEMHLDFFKDEEDFCDFKMIDYKDQALPSRLLKKFRNDTCVFLDDDKKCIIHEVKPLDCRIWPLTFDYKPEENKLIIYMGVCPLANALPESWVESTINLIIEELHQFEKDQLISYSISLSSIEDIKIIKEIPNFI